MTRCQLPTMDLVARQRGMKKPSLPPLLCLSHARKVVDRHFLDIKRSSNEVQNFVAQMPVRDLVFIPPKSASTSFNCWFEDCLIRYADAPSILLKITWLACLRFRG